VTVLATRLLGSAARYHDLGRWWCELFLLMPDHLHALVRIPSEAGLAPVVHDWKRGAARFHGVVWQENFFDHRIRHAKEGLEKWAYIRRNPVVKGFCSHEEAWPHVWAPPRDEEAR
jgi:putative transposase